MLGGVRLDSSKTRETLRGRKTERSTSDKHDDDDDDDDENDGRRAWGALLYAVMCGGKL